MVLTGRRLKQALRLPCLRDIEPAKQDCCYFLRKWPRSEISSKTSLVLCTSGLCAPSTKRMKRQQVPGTASSVFRSYEERLDDTRLVQTPEEDEAPQFLAAREDRMMCLTLPSTGADHQGAVCLSCQGAQTSPHFQLARGLPTLAATGIGMSWTSQPYVQLKSQSPLIAATIFGLSGCSWLLAALKCIGNNSPALILFDAVLN